MTKSWRCPTERPRFPALRGQLERCVVASVVPARERRLKRELVRRYRCPVHFVTAQNITGQKIRLKNKREIGADRVVDALAAYKLYGGPSIVVDFGTATTFDVISARGEYLGGAIAPGIDLARDALHDRTAKLPRISIEAPRRAIGRDTVSAMRSGLVYGYVAMVEGMVRRLKSEIRKTKAERRSKSKYPKIKVIATGGLAGLICKYTDIVDRIDINLTLQGLRLIGETILAESRR